MDWTPQRTRETTASVICEFLRYNWKIHRVKRTRSSSYVWAYHGRERLKVRISDHGANLNRRVPNLSIDPTSSNLQALSALLMMWSRRFRRRMQERKKCQRGRWAGKRG